MWFPPSTQSLLIAGLFSLLNSFAMNREADSLASHPPAYLCAFSRKTATAVQRPGLRGTCREGNSEVESRTRHTDLPAETSGRGEKQKRLLPLQTRPCAVCVCSPRCSCSCSARLLTGSFPPTIWARAPDFSLLLFKGVVCLVSPC